jgi:hypothetical protein
MEMSFVEPIDVQSAVEGAFAAVFSDAMGMTLSLPLPRMTWKQAMDSYGSDKPDTRFGLELIDVSDAVRGLGFPVFDACLSAGGKVRGINVKGLAEKLTRRELDSLAEYVKTFRANGLAWMMINPDGSVKSSFNKYLTPELMSALCTDHGASEVYVTEDPEEGAAFVSARRHAIPALERIGSLLLEDVGVPVPRLGELVAGIADIAAREQVTIAVVAHAGDGNTHPLIVTDPQDSALAARAQRAYGQVMDLAVALGGTITGEHGVGRLKQPWLAGQIGPDALGLMRAVKAAFDPQGILNPGAAL